MNNKTISLPVELVDKAVNGYVQEQGHALNEIRELLAAFLSNQSAPADKGQCEPVAYLCQGKGSKWLQYGSTVSDPWLPGEVELTPLYAEQPAPVAVVMPPEQCRQRIAYEGKPYPRSSCAVCGQFSPKSRECDALIEVARLNPIK